MKTKLLLICLSLLSLGMTDAIRQITPINAIFVGNNKGGTVSIIDADKLEVVSTINIIPDKAKANTKAYKQRLINKYVNKKLGPKYVDDLDILPDGQTMVVSRPYFSDIAAFDLNTQKMLWRLPLGHRPDHQVMTKDGKYLFVSLLVSKKGMKIDLENQKIVGTYKTGKRPHSIVLNQAETRLYNGSLNGNDIVVIDTETLKQVDRYTFPEGVRPFKLSVDEKKIYLQLSFYHGIAEYDMEKRQIIREIDMPIPDFVKSIKLKDYPFLAAHHGIGWSSDKQYMSVAATVSNYVGILSFPDLKLLKTFDAGIEPSWITDGFDADTFFVSSRGSDKVFVYSYSKQELLKTIEVGDYPQRMNRAVWMKKN